MMPGRMNPKQMQRMMKKMGLNMKGIDDAKEVVIYTESKEIHIKNPEVTIMDVKGEQTFQVQGDVEEKTLEEEVPKEDIELVMNQTGASEEEAKKALEEVDGEPAEAIIKLMS